MTYVSARLFVVASIAVISLGACGGGSNSRDETPLVDDSGDGDSTYNVSVKRTAYGIPHISGDNYGDIGYGYGYVHAEDNLCVLAEDLMTIRGERAQYFGRDGSYEIPANGSVASNVDSDFFWKFMATSEAITPMRDNSGAEALAASNGFVAGYNRYVGELRAGQHTGRHASCRDAEWIGPITEDDIYRRYYRLALIASSSVFVEGIATAAPPSATNPPLAVDSVAITNIKKQDFPLADGLDIGSNMYAFGPEGTADGSSMVFGNPHFPWSGTERLYISHMTTPDFDIMGASLYGVPAVLIGFNDKFAWSHTVSSAYRFTFYELDLDPSSPTSYLYDDTPTPMTPVEVNVGVLEADGSTSTETRTLYRSQYGPMLEFQVSGVPVLEWSTTKAYTMRDANAENDRLMNQFFRWNAAQSWEEFVDLHASVLGTPWVNTVASGPGKPAYYGDVTVVPNVPDELVASCAAQPLQAALAALVPGLPILNGSSSDCQWRNDEDAPAPGIFGRANLPTLIREDFVTNCNDSYWLTNPAEPIIGFDAIIGAEDTERSLRTRLCTLQAQRRLSGEDGLSGTGFTFEQLKAITLNSKVYSAELAMDSVLSNYCASPTLLGSNGPVDIAAACDVLSNWDRANNLDSVGGHIWREFWRQVAGPTETAGLTTKWQTPFSNSDPIHTPNTLNVLDPSVGRAFADGVQTVLDSPFGVDAAMGDIQHSGIHDSYIPVIGGEAFEGSFTIAGSVGGLKDEGYEVTYGNSYIQAVTWGEGGTPRAEGFITYSQSTDPTSPYYKDLTEAYADKNWATLPFTAEQIAAQPVLQTYQLSE
jgi:acyl-homoserine-lactone acylase